MICRSRCSGGKRFVGKLLGKLLGELLGDGGTTIVDVEGFYGWKPGGLYRIVAPNLPLGQLSGYQDLPEALRALME
jgi:hypothetical protein